MKVIKPGRKQPFSALPSGDYRDFLGFISSKDEERQRRIRSLQSKVRRPRPKLEVGMKSKQGFLPSSPPPLLPPSGPFSLPPPSNFCPTAHVSSFSAVFVFPQRQQPARQISISIFSEGRRTAAFVFSFTSPSIASSAVPSLPRRASQRRRDLVWCQLARPRMRGEKGSLFLTSSPPTRGESWSEDAAAALVASPKS